jgi:hypothetical protein
MRMKVKIDGKVLDYEGEGCYNFNTGKRVHDIHLHSTSNEIQYVNLDEPSMITHTYAPVTQHTFIKDWESFAAGVVVGVMLSAMFIILIVVIGASL